MNKTLAAILIVIVGVLGVGGAYVLFIKDDTTSDQSTQLTTETAQDAAESSATNNSTPNENTSEQSTEQSQTTSVAIKNFAFVPASITVKKVRPLLGQTRTARSTMPFLSKMVVQKDDC